LIKRKKNSFRNIVIKKFQENKKIKLKNLKENIFYLENFPKTYLLIFSKIKLNQIYSFFKQQYDKSQIIILIFPKKRHCSLLFQKTKLDQLNNVNIFNWNQKKKIIKFLKKSLIKSRNETFSNLSSKFL